ncbi:hypothetical protein LS71_007660 [Helicobacter jaachi]|uniref:Uncharacterized protein n=1 Tax=Helicobacter jaachi TaxID=1677920 RepID=A0A4U8T8S1_9HELI|nr:hypothetical protein [Helicobacter jaachi]TLD96109.1 hypothetical protein LS71_007660 [Helicobacter jaachi]
MKVAIDCVSPLVQSSLNAFLKHYLASQEECDFIITDDMQKVSQKPLCFVGDDECCHIHKPFTQKSLLKDIQAFYEQHLDKFATPHESITLHETATLNELATQDTESSLSALKAFEPPMSAPQYPHDDLEDKIQALCEQSAKELAHKIMTLLKHQS